MEFEGLVRRAVQLRSTSSQIPLISSQTLPNSGQPWPLASNFVRNPAKDGRNSAASCGNPAEVGRDRSKFGRNHSDVVECGRSWARCCRIPVIVGRAWANIARSRPEIVRTRATTGRSTRGQHPTIASFLVTSSAHDSHSSRPCANPWSVSHRGGRERAPRTHCRPERAYVRPPRAGRRRSLERADHCGCGRRLPACAACVWGAGVGGLISEAGGVRPSCIPPIRNSSSVLASCVERVAFLPARHELGSVAGGLAVPSRRTFLCARATPLG